MAKIDVINLKGEKTNDIKLNDSIWKIGTLFVTNIYFAANFCGINQHKSLHVICNAIGKKSAAE